MTPPGPEDAIDLDAVLDSALKRSDPGCRFVRLSQTAKALYERGIERKVSISAITRAINNLGNDISRASVDRHHAGECRCREKK